MPDIDDIPQRGLRDDLYKIMGRAKTDESRALIHTLAKALSEENRLDFASYIPVEHVDYESVDISDFQYGEHYEVPYFYRFDDHEDNEQEMDSEQRDEYVERCENEIEVLEAEKSKLETDLDECPERKKKLRSSIQTAIDAVSAKIKTWEDAKARAEDAEEEYSEIYVNFVRLYGRRLSGVDISQYPNLGKGTFIAGPHEGEDFVFLTGCGMDLSPAYSALELLEFGRTGESSWLTEISYGIYVMGKANFNRICEKFKIPAEAVEYAHADQKRRMEIFDANIKRIAAIREKDPVLGVALAMSLATGLLAQKG